MKKKKTEISGFVKPENIIDDFELLKLKNSMLVLFGNLDEFVSEIGCINLYFKIPVGKSLECAMAVDGYMVDPESITVQFISDEFCDSQLVSVYGDFEYVVEFLEIVRDCVYG